MEVVLEAENGNELLEKISNVRLDVVLLDIQMPAKDGYETCAALARKYPDLKILILSQLNSKETILKMVNLGASGYFTKNSEPEEIEKAINNVYQEGFFFGNDLNFILKDFLQNGKENPDYIDNCVAVSKREVEIIKLACREFSSSEIALQLSISTRTVDAHRNRLMEKYKTKNFVGVILQSLKNNVIALEDF
jgi:DNA-binding NarL/FixJ family response regulator